MKSLILTVFAFTTLTISNVSAAVGTTLKVEGSCSGTLRDGTSVNFTYYSNFNGCRKVNKAALSLNAAETLLTGSRSFKNNQDIYVFPAHQLTFADSTGNTSAKLLYTDGRGVKRTVTVSCEVRDYEYSDC